MKVLPEEASLIKIKSTSSTSAPVKPILSQSIYYTQLQSLSMLSYERYKKLFNDEGFNKLFYDKNKFKSLFHTSGPYYLFFDTETTGLPLDNYAPTSNTANWPRLVQLSWIVTDVDGNIFKESDKIIYPEGFTIPTESSNIHGITTAIAKRRGIPLATAVEEFLEDMKTVNTLVGHNISFDLHIMGAELVRMGKRDIMQQKPSICTMQSSVNYCKIPSKNGFGYKWPRLQELHVKLFGYEFEDAHNSMSDITATLKCFKELKRRGIINK